MRYPCYALDVTQSFGAKALLCTNLCAQAFSTEHEDALGPTAPKTVRMPISRPESSRFNASPNTLRPPRGDPNWVPSDRWFHRSHLNPAITGEAGVGRIA